MFCFDRGLHEPFIWSSIAGGIAQVSMHHTVRLKISS